MSMKINSTWFCKIKIFNMYYETLKGEGSGFVSQNKNVYFQRILEYVPYYLNNTFYIYVGQ